jgi:hypothetical protein
MNESNFLEPENENLFKFLKEAYNREKMSGQIKQMVTDKVKLTDFSNFNIPEKKVLFWYRNPILNSMLILLSLGLLTTMFYNYYSTDENPTKQVKTDVTINSHFDHYDINKLKAENETYKLTNKNQKVNEEKEKLISKEKLDIESTITSTETIVRSSVNLPKNFSDINVLKNEIVNIFKELKLNHNEFIKNDMLFLIESKESIGFYNDANSNVKYKVKFFISKNEPLKLKIHLIYANILKTKKSNIDVHNLFYDSIKNRVSSIIKQNN